MNDRTRLSLDGIWQFQIDPTGEKGIDDIQEWRQAQVPLPWQAQFDDLRHTSGVGWYRRSLPLDEAPTGAAILHFGAVDYHTTVWLNGTRIGEHEGGYLPFEFDVAGHLRAGDNDLVVRVVDPDDDRTRWPDHPFSEIPHGKQSWYGPIGGIWQSVWLEMRPALHIRSLRLTPDPNSGSIAVDVVLNQDATAQAQITVTDPDGARVVETALAGLSGPVALDGDVTLWSPESPALYTVTATLLVDGEPVDEVSDRCGFRTVEARDGRIYLNGEPIYLRGVLDQAYYPETIYTPPSLEFLEDQARKAKELGLNCLRTHIKIEDPRYYEVADRLGLLIWTEIPNWEHLSEEAAARAKETFRRMVERDWNHPSIIAWTLVNEDWGTDLARNPDHRRWLADFYAEARQIDPTRLIVDNSACHGNLHVASDIEDYHHYRAIPDHAAEWDQWVEAFVGRADWCWAADYAENRRADLPLIVSEFGNWGLPDPAQIRENGKEPWWFETGYERNGGIVYPHGMRNRFHEYGLDEVFGSLANFTAQHQRHMARSLAYEIASMRLHPRIGGYVVTEFTDVHWECNGLLDMQRNVKQNLDEFVTINQDRVVVVRPQRWSGKAGETLPVDLRAFGVDGPGTGGRIHWRANSAEGEIAAPGGTVAIPLPDDRPAGVLAIQAQWLADDGAVLAEGTVEAAWVTPAPPDQPIHVVDDDDLAHTLRTLGYNLADSPQPASVLVARRYTEDLQTAVQQGAHLLLLAGTEAGCGEDEVRLPVGTVVPRAGTNWQGDWATSFAWLKKRGPFADLPGDPLLGMEYAALMPDAVLAGVPQWALKTHSWANLALGWIHEPVSLLAEMPYGRGYIVVSTFNLAAGALAEDAVAQALLGGMLKLTTGREERKGRD